MSEDTTHGDTTRVVAAHWPLKSRPTWILISGACTRLPQSFRISTLHSCRYKQNRMDDLGASDVILLKKELKTCSLVKKSCIALTNTCINYLDYNAKMATMYLYPCKDLIFTSEEFSRRNL